ncbi:UxaA family hydrolase [Litorivicinus sp.]|nr:UxaA family hydrolase [Litorivicinus sp.]
MTETHYAPHFQNSEGFYGYLRAGSRGIGIRNYTIVCSLAPCTDSWIVDVPRKFAPSVKAIPSPGFCSRDAGFLDRLMKLLSNPNVFSVIFVDQRCSSIDLDYVVNGLKSQGIPSYSLAIDSFECLADFHCHLDAVINQNLNEASAISRSSASWSSLCIGAKCGGSDWTTGLFANPLVRSIFEELISLNGWGMVSELGEYLGVESLILDQIKDAALQEKFLYALKLKFDKLRSFGTDAFMVKGNLDGGLFTPEEKALGSYAKFSGLKIIEVLDVNPKVEVFDRMRRDGGIVLQLGSNQEPQVFTEMAYAGCVGALFTTGLGGGFNHPLTPLFVISPRVSVEKKMSTFFADFSPSPEECVEDVESLRDKLFSKFERWINGELSKVEKESVDAFQWSL